MIHYSDDRATIHAGNCLDILADLPPNSVDAIITDPPYGLANTTPADVTDTITQWATGDRTHTPTGRGFLGHEWDAFVPPPAVWDQCLRVLKPGGHLAAFAGSRTVDLMALSIRLAGFDIRDQLQWLYGSGFPKSIDVARSVEAHLTRDLEPEYRFTEWARSTGVTARQLDALAGTSGMGGHWLTAGQQPAIPTAEQLAKLRPVWPDVPAWVEDVVALRDRERREAQERNAGKQFLESLGDGQMPPATHPDAVRWAGWGTALKPAHEPIVLARAPLARVDGAKTVGANVAEYGTGALNIDAARNDDDRYPANVVLDEDAADVLDEQSGVRKSGARKAGTYGLMGYMGADAAPMPAIAASSGGASRFFYTAKAATSERVTVDGVEHPTVKPLDLMQWLVRLLTPTGGTVLDPFAGSGTTIEAALLTGHHAIGVEAHAPYLPLIETRIARRRDPARALELTGQDLGLFDLEP